MSEASCEQVTVEGVPAEVSCENEQWTIKGGDSNIGNFSFGLFASKEEAITFLKSYVLWVHGQDARPRVG